MPRFGTGARAAGAGSTTLPSGSLYAGAAVSPRLREVGIFNTAAVAVAVKLVRLTTAGTQGAGLVEADQAVADAVAASAAFNTHTGAPTLGDDLGYRTALAAAVGSGVIWTFGADGIAIPVGTGNGIGIIIATGTGQILDWYLVFDE